MEVRKAFPRQKGRASRGTRRRDREEQGLSAVWVAAVDEAA